MQSSEIKQPTNKKKLLKIGRYVLSFYILGNVVGELNKKQPILDQAPIAIVKTALNKLPSNTPNEQLASHVSEGFVDSIGGISQTVANFKESMPQPIQDINKLIFVATTLTLGVIRGVKTARKMNKWLDN